MRLENIWGPGRFIFDFGLKLISDTHIGHKESQTTGTKEMKIVFRCMFKMDFGMMIFVINSTMEFL